MGGGGYNSYPHNDLENVNNLTKNKINDNVEYTHNDTKIQQKKVKDPNKLQKWSNLALVIVFVLGFFMSTMFSMGYLHSSKTATGVIAFEFDSPTLSFDPMLALYADGILGNTATITHGNDSTAGSSMDTLKALNIKLNKNKSQLNNFYIKILYDFSEITGDFSFGTFSESSYVLTSGDATMNMSKFEKSTTANEYFSVSTNQVSSGFSFDVYSPLRKINFTSSAIDDAKHSFKIIVFADYVSTFSSKSCTSATINGTIGMHYYDTPVIDFASLNADQISFIGTWKRRDGVPYVLSFYVSGDSYIVINKPAKIRVSLEMPQSFCTTTTNFVSYNNEYSITPKSVVMTTQQEVSGKYDYFWDLFWHHDYNKDEEYLSPYDASIPGSDITIKIFYEVGDGVVEAISFHPGLGYNMTQD